MLSFNMLSFNACPAGMDLLGAPVFTKDFVVSGTCTPNLHGMCEAMYRPDMVRSKSHFRYYLHGCYHTVKEWSLHFFPLLLFSSACISLFSFFIFSSLLCFSLTDFFNLVSQARDVLCSPFSCFSPSIQLLYPTTRFKIYFQFFLMLSLILSIALNFPRRCFFSVAPSLFCLPYPLSFQPSIFQNLVRYLSTVTLVALPFSLFDPKGTSSLLLFSLLLSPPLFTSLTPISSSFHFSRMLTSSLRFFLSVFSVL